MSESLRHQFISDLHARGYAEVRSEFQSREPEDMYSLLFPIAVNFKADGADGHAGQLLAELEPRCPVSCEEAILTVVRSRWWQVSDERVPFYPLCQFGRKELFAAVTNLFAGKMMDACEADIVNGIWYWAKLPTLILADRIREYSSLYRCDSPAG